MGRRALQDESKEFWDWITAEKDLTPQTAATYASTLRFTLNLFGSKTPDEETVQEVWSTVQTDFPRRCGVVLRTWDLYLEWSGNPFPAFPRKTVKASALEPLPQCAQDLIRTLLRMKYTKTFISELTVGQVVEVPIPQLSDNEYAFPRPGNKHRFVVVPRRFMEDTLKWAQHPNPSAPLIPKSPGSELPYPKSRYPTVS